MGRKSTRRPYRSPRREEQARATRRAILDAALELFTGQGFAATSIREVAERARVSEQTVYNAFGDKVGLLYSAGLEYADLAAGQAEAAFLVALAAEADPIERIRMVARSSRELWEGGALELDLMVFNPELHDRRLEELAEKSLAYRVAGTRAVCEVLFPDDVRRPGIRLDDIVVFGTAVDSGATVQAVKALGWSMDRWEAWIVQLLVLFLDPSRVPGVAETLAQP